jgi:hypothetical protein
MSVIRLRGIATDRDSVLLDVDGRRVILMLEEKLTIDPNADLLAACKEHVAWFDEMTRYDEPGDQFAEARARYHYDRIERTRAAIRTAEGES